jgi:hypothetical protein
MVLPYLKGLIIIKCGFSIVLVDIVVVYFVYQI